MRGHKQAEYDHLSAPEDKPQAGDEAMVHLSLEGILPPGHILAVHPHLGILAHLSCDFEGPRLKSVQRFSATEMCLLLPLLQQHPAYCPYEVLLAHFTSARVTEETITRAREQLYEAQEAGIWDSMMRPIRNVLSRARFRLGDLGIGVVSMLEMGYMLKLHQSDEQRASTDTHERESSDGNDLVYAHLHHSPAWMVEPKERSNS